MAEKVETNNKPKKKYRIAIIGPGGVGGFLAAVLQSAGHEIIILARPERAQELKQKGIALESKVFGRMHEMMRIENQLLEKVDVIFITTKAYSLTEVLPSITKAALGVDTLIIPLLNGIEHYDILHKEFPNNSVSGTISIEAFQKSTGVIAHTSSFARLSLAADLEKLKSKVKETALLLKDAGLECVIAENEREILWKKLVRLSAVSLSTAATHLPIGKIRIDPKWRPRLLAIVSEACVVARLDGIIIEPTLREIDGLDPGQLSSLERDVREGKRTELENIAGSVVRKAHFGKIKVPTIEAVMDEIRSQYKSA
jgi:2-dehydropantoate 2-reductase